MMIFTHQSFLTIHASCLSSLKSACIIESLGISPNSNLRYNSITLTLVPQMSQMQCKKNTCRNVPPRGSCRGSDAQRV